MKRLFTFLLICIMAISVSGCGDKNTEDNKTDESTTSYQDGVYHAEYDRKDVRNWIPYVDVTIKDGKITKAYYDYTNDAGDTRTNDENYTKNFSAANNGMTPREAFDKLGSQLVDKQDIQDVDAVSGATHSSRNFTELSTAALQNAVKGDTTAAKIPLYDDGVYKVEADAFDDHGWKPFIELTIKDDKITNVVFDYKDESGNLKTADAEYKKNMEKANGTYPEKYSKELVQQLLDKQVISQVDAVTGATTSSNNFTALVEYALDDMAEVGDTQPAIIKLETE
ncbi:FMN-binding protein [Clostridium aminobutyricum]|uniref:FMN-binding protein n=1 Tax=Clostridium aminobutyricum TaxID=33953 RepID=A0A939DC87_CLOAM|nr:FMN-binding protein [Clostridium aminobutyricum]MBN7774603.1 FMN-binding protein [Clostridium aminobutyricum]